MSSLLSLPPRPGEIPLRAFIRPTTSPLCVDAFSEIFLSMEKKLGEGKTFFISLKKRALRKN
ncbi:MAG: hypothetical protein A2W09_01675 [Deltaproteobacteria bacterium RBG_16_50_11]|nr:MAG: hypothetical protein A2W09_01675 [Deltaproteobacteria bacterium RBG_16_50_11]